MYMYIKKVNGNRSENWEVMARPTVSWQRVPDATDNLSSFSDFLGSVILHMKERYCMHIYAPVHDQFTVFPRIVSTPRIHRTLELTAQFKVYYTIYRIAGNIGGN